ATTSPRCSSTTTGAWRRRRRRWAFSVRICTGRPGSSAFRSSGSPNNVKTIMRKQTLSIVLAGVFAANAALAQQPPGTQAPPKPAPPLTRGTTYKPDFEIPKLEGTNDKPKTDPAALGTSVEGYVIGPQDQLSIIVTDETELTGKYRVDNDGTISM